MDTQTVLTNPPIEGTGLDFSCKKTLNQIRKGIKQNFKFLRLVNPYFSCKSEDEYEEYKRQLHTLLDEAITMKLAVFARSRD